MNKTLILIKLTLQWEEHKKQAINYRICLESDVLYIKNIFMYIYILKNSTIRSKTVNCNF